MVYNLIHHPNTIMIKYCQLFIGFPTQAHTNEIQLLVAVVEYKTRIQAPRRGVCSTWLASLDSSRRPTVPLWVKKGTINFPCDDARPVIMVGPGTSCCRVFMPPPFKEWRRGINCYPCPCVHSSVRACVSPYVRPSFIKLCRPLKNF